MEKVGETLFYKGGQVRPLEGFILRPKGLDAGNVKFMGKMFQGTAWTKAPRL